MWIAIVVNVLVLVKGTTQLCRTSELSINAKDENNYCVNKPEKIWRVFDPEATHSLGKCNKMAIPALVIFPSLFLLIHTATTQCGSGSYLVEALTVLIPVLILCAYLYSEHPSSSFQKV